ncbi:hypothetical protein EXIGLDRAFT_781834 [Exidia glandulosa HHB12029]|uniref:Uncharacterized protein n=1 Tax=Exidia glandulosa HHB12029 TaxID=1314781 RepID=A0A165B4L2_EXIGL|nr:hypothetical protein EXIGLDRAFT_781834 [Exidia glandulosa HHB12029]
MSADATALKEQGNALFREHKFAEAFDKYRDALAVTDEQNSSAVATLRANRAQCCLMLERRGAKLEAAEALVADIYHGKAWYRLGKAYLSANGIVKAIQLLHCAEGLIQGRDGKADVVKLRQDAYAAYKDKYWSPSGEDPHADEEKDVPLESASPHTAARVAHLKAEAQQLVKRGRPGPLLAYAKYTLALVFDPASAQLHAKRAHVANKLKISYYAGVDARAAIRLDSSNAEAWARLGTSLCELKTPQKGTDAFTHALFLLEAAPQPLSSEDSKLRKELVSSLALLRRAPKPFQNATQFNADSQTPWYKAEQLLGAARDFVPEDMKTWHKSYWYIYPAHEDFAKALDAMYNFDVHGTYGSTDALEVLTNAILIDLRAFGCTVWRVDFQKSYKLLVKYDLDKFNGFTKDENSAPIKAIEARLRQQGSWGESSATMTSVRKSLETTVRARVIIAFMCFAADGDLDAGISIFKPLLSFLEKGRKEWGGVPTEERGTIFDLPFLLGVEKHYIDCLRRRYTSYRQLAIPDAAGYLEQIKALAEKMLKQISSLPAADRIPNHDTRPPSYVLGYIIMPEAWAHDSLRFYYYKRSKQTPKHEDKVPLLMQAAAHAAIAETLFPDDDERHTVAVYDRLVSLFLLQRPLRETLPVCDKLAESYERSRAIWDYSFDLSHYTSCLEFAEEAKKSLRDGKVTLNDAIVPKDLDSLP